jgi:hypothetical protein
MAMKRREFIAGISSATAWPVVVWAQQSGETRRIGALIAFAKDDLPACQTILNGIGNLLADRCQVKEFLFAEHIFGFFGELPIHCRLVP